MTSHEMTKEQAYKVSLDIRKAGGIPEERLRAKCQWEHMTRMGVVLEWGDPREWDDD